MVLSQSKIGKVYTVVGIKLPKDITRRLQVLGFTQGTKVLILNKKVSGALIFKIRGARYALGKEYADGIYVEDGICAEKEDTAKAGTING